MQQAEANDHNNGPFGAVPPHVERRYQPENPDRMEFASAEERRLSMAVKRAIEDSPEIDNLPDFHYVQLALSCRDRIRDHGDGEAQNTSGIIIEEALKAAQHMQKFRHEYNVLDTEADSARGIAEILDLMGPTVFLNFCFNARDGNYCLIYDIAAITQKMLKGSPRAPEIYFRGCYYMLHALTCDFTAIRNGCILIAECDGFDWREHMDFNTAKRILTELTYCYPFTFQKCKYFHTGVFMNLMNSLKRRFMPRRIMEKMDTACQFDGRLSDIYLVPDAETACRKVKANFQEVLQLRYQNAENFRLDEDTSADALLRTSMHDMNGQAE